MLRLNAKQNLIEIGGSRRKREKKREAENSILFL